MEIQELTRGAGNTYLIDLDELVNDGLLTTDEIRSFNWGIDETDIDYAILYENRIKILQKAFQRFDTNAQDFNSFRNENKEWLSEFALFMSLKTENLNKSWRSWPIELRDRQPVALEKHIVDVENNMKTNNQAFIGAAFTSNHDTGRSAGFYAGDYSEAMTKMGQGITMMMGGCYYLYYGDEIGMKGSGDDENKRAPMVWHDDSILVLEKDYNGEKITIVMNTSAEKKEVKVGNDALKLSGLLLTSTENASYESGIATMPAYSIMLLKIVL